MKRAAALKLFAAVFIGISSVVSVSAQSLEVAQTLPHQEENSVFSQSEPELLVLQVTFGRYLLHDGLLGYLHAGKVYLPLGELAAILDLAINVNPDSGTADGWFLAESRRFSLSVPQRTAVVEGSAHRFTPDHVFIRDLEIFVQDALLSRWFPLDFKFDLSQLSLDVKPRETLPFQAKLNRGKLRDKLNHRAFPPDAGYPVRDDPYRLLDWPAIDTVYNFDYENDSESKTRSQYNSLISGDLLFMNAEAFLSGSGEDPLSDLRVKLGRKNPDAGLLGPLNATEFALGDVFSPQLPLISRSGSGAGLEISSFPLFQQREFDRINLRGELPLGWEVELYRNDTLIDSQVAANADGRYEFADVPLLFGNNFLRLVLYGPQGQKREQVLRLPVGQGQAQPGKQYFRAAANFKNRDLFEVGEGRTFPETGDGQGRYYFEYEIGAHRRFSLAANFASLRLKRGRRHFASLGIRGSLWGMFTRLDITKNDAGGTAGQVALQTELGGLHLFAQHSRFVDYVNERFQDLSDAIASESELRVDGTLPEWNIFPRIPWSLRGEIEERQSDRLQYRVSNRLSTLFTGISLSNTLNWQHAQGGGFRSQSRGDGFVLASGRVSKFVLRGTLAYDFQPDLELDSTSVTGDYYLSRNFSARLGVNRQLNSSQTTRYNAGINRRFESFALGLNGTVSDDGTYTAGTSITFSLGREPRHKRWVVLADRMATSGAASARVFLDNNQNETFDKGDEPLENVSFKGRNRNLKTGKDGVAFLPGLGSFRPLSLSVDAASLEDPFWVLPNAGYRFVPRPGRTIQLDFPVYTTGEIEGTVLLNKGGRETPVSNVTMQLLRSTDAFKMKLVRRLRQYLDRHYIDSEGRVTRMRDFNRSFLIFGSRAEDPSRSAFSRKQISSLEFPARDEPHEVVQEVKTEFDGFYLFEKIPPGTYLVRVSPQQARRLQMQSTANRKVNVQGSGSLVQGVDFVLKALRPQPHFPEGIKMANNPNR